MHFRDMPYQRVTYGEIEAEYEALFRDVQAVSCEEDCLRVLKRQYRLGDAMTPIDLCYVRHGMDVNDPFYAQEQAYYDEIGPRISALRNRFGELLVKSPFADCFERLMGSFAFTLVRTALMGNDDSLIPLQQEENALLSRYNQLVSNAKADYGGERVSRSSLARDQQSPDREVRRRAYQAAVDSWEEQRGALEDIYDSLVKNRDRQAKALGYANFTQLSYVRMNRIGYTPEDVRRFREQVKAQLVPVAAALNERRRARLGLDRLYPYDGGIFFPEGNPVPLGDEQFCLDMTRRMYESLSPETSEYIGFMMDNGLYDVTMRDGKLSGGYCTLLEAYRAPFIFANFDGTSENAYIMTHKGGHGFYFYNTMQSGQDDMINGAWGGAEMDPYSMMICWTDPDYIMEYGFDPYQPLTISVQGAEITMSYYDWYNELYNGAYAVAELDVRNEILAGMEKGLLLNYHMIPIFSSCGASLASHRIIYGSEDYINSLVGRGGIQFMTYSMDDAEWAAYCAQQGNQLSY